MYPEIKSLSEIIWRYFLAISINEIVLDIVEMQYVIDIDESRLLLARNTCKLMLFF